MKKIILLFSFVFLASCSQGSNISVNTQNQSSSVSTSTNVAHTEVQKESPTRDIALPKVTDKTLHIKIKNHNTDVKIPQLTVGFIFDYVKMTDTDVLYTILAGKGNKDMYLDLIVNTLGSRENIKVIDELMQEWVEFNLMNKYISVATSKFVNKEKGNGFNIHIDDRSWNKKLPQNILIDLSEVRKNLEGGKLYIKFSDKWEHNTVVKYFLDDGSEHVFPNDVIAKRAGKKGDFNVICRNQKPGCYLSFPDNIVSRIVAVYIDYVPENK